MNNGLKVKFENEVLGWKERMVIADTLKKKIDIILEKEEEPSQEHIMEITEQLKKITYGNVLSKLLEFVDDEGNATEDFVDSMIDDVLGEIWAMDGNLNGSDGNSSGFTLQQMTMEIASWAEEARQIGIEQAMECGEIDEDEADEKDITGFIRDYSYIRDIAECCVDKIDPPDSILKISELEELREGYLKYYGEDSI